MTPIDVLSAKDFAIFAGLDEEELISLARATTLVVLGPDEVLFHQGAAGDSLYLLASGRVKVLAREHGGPDHLLATLDPGAILGEGAVLSDAPRTATAKAVTPCRLWQISRSSFRGSIERGQPWAVTLLLAIAVVLAERLANVDGLLLDAIANEREKDEASAGAKVAELERLRRRLLTDWTF